MEKYPLSSRMIRFWGLAIPQCLIIKSNRNATDASSYYLTEFLRLV